MSEYVGDYYIGIDMGTNSVGWAVTDTKYHILRAKGKDMWGARIFNDASTAANRRSNRVNRRRRAREKSRISMLQELFSSEINKVDSGFYHRLDESKFWIEDRTESNEGQKYAIFAKNSTGDIEYTDRDYYKQYPTIFHLRLELAKSKEPHDVRLLYLALLNMFKHRGHFLNETLSDEGEMNIDEAWNEFIDAYNCFSDSIIEDNDNSQNVFDTENKSGLFAVLSKKGVSKSQIREEAAEMLHINKTDKKDFEILSLICGLTSNLENIFGEDSLAAIDDNAKKKINFRKSSYDDDFEVIQAALVEEYISLLMAVKEVHDVILFNQIMQGKSFISEARKEVYEQHKQDLILLKQVVKRLAPERYTNLFREMEDGTYSAYIGSTNSDKADGKVRRYIANHGTKIHNNEPDALYKTIKTILSPFKEDKDVQIIFERIENETFLSKQLTSANGIIPNQVYVREMRAILANAEEYLPFLKQVDDSGFTVSERILKLFSYCVPYYVGPVGGLKDNNGNKWAVRLKSDAVMPWNIEQVIDMNLTRQKFIEKLIRRCTYISSAKVMPKRSLLYEKYMVLNELNNLKIEGKKISVELKQDIYNSLFMKGKPVTLKQLTSFLVTKGIIVRGDGNLISGIDGAFHNYLTSVGKFNGVFESPYLDREHMELIEDIIRIGTIYGDAKKLFLGEIEKKYGMRSNAKCKLTEKQIQRIAGFKFSGWGNLSREFLELEGASREDGEIRTIIRSLWETNDNLMQILSDSYTYQENLKNIVEKREKELSDWSIDDLDGMYLSAPVKRMVWQTLRVLREIEDVMGRAPKRVFIEMTRENRKKGVRTKSRKSQLLEIYKNAELKKEQRNWISELNSYSDQEFKIRKLYLYYCQMGRCMYTDTEIDIDQLMDDDLYDIDHIYPQSDVKDDSIENNLVLVNKKENKRKGDKYPINPTIQYKCKDLWSRLLKYNLISKEKYDRLMRKEEFSVEERTGFVQRQLVETSQGAKAITQILQGVLPDNSDLAFSKAGLVSSFRDEFKIWKCRNVNDFHHAQDAYLNIVVGNVYFTKFTRNPKHFIEQSILKQDDQYKYHIGKMFQYTVKRGADIAWIADEHGKNNSIDTIKKQVFKTTPLITRRGYVSSGAITRKDTNYGKQKTANAPANTYFPVKTSDCRLNNVSKYGGKSDIRTAAYSLVCYKEGIKEIRSIEPIPVFMMQNGKLDEKKQADLLKYFVDIISRKSKKVCKDFCIKYPVIKLNSLLKIDGYYYYIGGKTKESYYLYNAVPLKISNNEAMYVKKIDKAIQSNYYEERNDKNELILTKQNNEILFNLLIDKLNNGIFIKRKGGLRASLNENKDEFYGLDIKTQCKILKEIILSFGSSTQNVDISDLGDGSAHAGTYALPKHIEKLNECILINQSVTGLFENEVDLLRI